jgi:hypothetical protein
LAGSGINFKKNWAKLPLPIKPNLEEGQKHDDLFKKLFSDAGVL